MKAGTRRRLTGNLRKTCQDIEFEIKATDALFTDAAATRELQPSFADIAAMTFSSSFDLAPLASYCNYTGLTLSPSYNEPWDLTTTQGVDHWFSLFTNCQPLVVLIIFPDSLWNPLTNINYSNRPESLDRLRTRDRWLLDYVWYTVDAHTSGG